MPMCGQTFMITVQVCDILDAKGVVNDCSKHKTIQNKVHGNLDLIRMHTRTAMYNHAYSTCSNPLNCLGKKTNLQK